MEVFPGIFIVDINAEVHAACLWVIAVAPAAGGVILIKIKSLAGKHFFMLIGCVQVKHKHAVFFHKERGFCDGLFKVFQRTDVVIGIESGNRGADGTVQVQLQQVLAQQHRVGQRQAKRHRLCPAGR